MIIVVKKYAWNIPKAIGFSKVTRKQFDKPGLPPNINL